ncbi:MAG: 2-oxoacid:acceptor oxidoreductase family protein [Desulfobacteraceae bacterium]|jgi:indolepyruvate ferredoxin oxidoreductase, beta subunit
MKQFNIYLTGVGGQGIGLLSEAILRAADYAGHLVKGVDTHGLAQRGGIVVSQIRLGTQVHTPLVPRHQADLLISLERHEALRALTDFAKHGATLIYYNTVWQPLDVRLGTAREVSAEAVEALCRQMGVERIEVYHPDLEDVRMQNVALLARIDKEGLVPGVKSENYRQALEDLMAGSMLKKNLALYEAKRTAA